MTKTILSIILVTVLIVCCNSYHYHQTSYRYLRLYSNSNSNSKSNSNNINCEKEGSCRQVRGAFKDELNAYRELKRSQGISSESADYLSLLSSSKAAASTSSSKEAEPVKKYSPFKKH